MALYNEILVGRFNKLLSKLFSMKGQAPAPQLSSEITPGIVFSLGVEVRYLESWERYWAITVTPAVAAQTSLSQLQNRSTTGIVAVIESVTFFTGLANSIEISKNPLPTIFTSDLTTPVSAIRDDLRSRPQSSVICSFQNTGGALSLIRRVPTVANVLAVDFILDDNMEVVLMPADVFRLNTQIVNDSLTVMYRWRERALEESEKF